MKKFLFLVGARPQIIKFAALERYLEEFNISHTLVHSGQHYDPNLSDNFFNELNIKAPDFNLEAGSGSHANQTATIMVLLEKTVNRIKPDFGVVFGDTNTTLAGALFFSKMSIPLIHVEAGLRSYKKHMPEEINRVVTDRLSSVLFAPSHNAEKNLYKEGITQNVFFTGDLHYDLFKLMEKYIERVKLQLPFRDFVLLTVHREENTKDPDFINQLLNRLETNHINVVFPCHPRTCKLIRNNGFKHIYIIPPTSYMEMLWLIKNSYMVITDSGGIQREAFYLKKNIIILREETEWTEIIELGFGKLAGGNIDKVIELIKRPWEPGYFHEIYGDGKAGKKIVEILKKL